MTFDEAIEKSRALSLDGTQQIYSDDVIQLINELREEYAPTVEMTKEQYKIFNEDMQLNQTALYDYIDDSMGLPMITNKQMLNLYIHPETIKVVN